VSAVTVNIVVPVYNEEAALARSLGILTAFLARYCSHPCEVVIANNGSTDRTLEVARRLAEQHPGVSVLRLCSPRSRSTRIRLGRCVGAAK
jgi:glycosyltransferase involved in cell wall biosynthesis